MVHEVFIEEFLEDVEISFALHFFGIPADDSLGFPGKRCCSLPRSDHPAMHRAQRATVAPNLLS